MDPTENKKWEEAHLLRIRFLINSYLQKIDHATRCNSEACKISSYRRMQSVVAHTQNCKIVASGRPCFLCKELVMFCTHHVKHCGKVQCVLPFCGPLKAMIRRRNLQKRIERNLTRHLTHLGVPTAMELRRRETKIFTVSPGSVRRLNFLGIKAVTLEGADTRKVPSKPAKPTSQGVFVTAARLASALKVVFLARCLSKMEL